MKKIYLRINYGGDDRFNLTSKTIKLSAPYFEKIIVCNFGPDENRNKFLPLLNQFSNLTVDNLGKYYHMNITEDLLRYSYKYVNDGDWIAMLDSDWRFPQYFLDNMQSEIEKCETEGYNHIFSYQLGHFLNDESKYHYSQEKLNTIIEKWKNNPNSYGWPILNKVDKKNLWTDGFYGNHCYDLFVPYNKKNIPEMFHIHIRDFSPHGYCSSMIFQSWWYIGHNVFPLENHKEINNSWEFCEIETFKIKHSCFTPNHLRKCMEDFNFLNLLKTLFLKFENSKIFACKQMYDMASKYEMNFINNDPSEIECNGVCCKYKI